MEAPGSPYASSPDTTPKCTPCSSPPPPQDRPDADHDPAAEHEGSEAMFAHIGHFSYSAMQVLLNFSN
ncbi:hypothetical protein ZWY2020_005974 [Hordeum vulgare]|nr:hypothetical protein ZWY2020_005974 [Hordeum vulgare]